MNAIQIAEIAESWVAAKMDAYIQKVAEVYSLSVEELKGIAKDVSVPSSCEAANVLEKKKLMKLKKVDLQSKCKELGHRVTGNKSELCDRILSGAAKTKETVKNKSKKSKPKQEENLRVCKSKHGNYTYDGLVIDKGTRMVVGIELNDGRVGPLTKAGIDKCHRYKLKFAIPLNLDATEEKSNSEEEEEELECIEENEMEIEEEEEEEEEEDDDDDDEEEEIEIEEECEEEIEIEEEEDDTNVGDDENEDDEDIEYEVYDD